MANRTALFSRKQPGGVFTIDDLKEHPGDIWFVDSGSGTDGAGYGKDPDSPLATIDYAIGLCTASQGDVIYVMPGHAETVSGASGIDVDVAGIKIVGLGWGDLRPTVSLSASASTVEINADDTWIENIIFAGTFTNGVAKAVDIKSGADDTTIKNCVFRASLATQELLIAINLEATISRVNIIGCEFYEVTGGDATGAITTEGAVTDLRIVDCFFSGDWSAATLDLDAGTNAIVRAHIINNIAYNADVTAGLFCSIDSGSVGYFLGNRTGVGKSNTEPVTDVTACVLIDNMGTDLPATAAIAFPAAATAWS